MTQVTCSDSTAAATAINSFASSAAVYFGLFQFDFDQ